MALPDPPHAAAPDHDPLAALDPWLEALPVLPDLVMRLVTLDLHAEGGYDEVVAIAQEDPTFAARVLSLANSAALAPGVPVTAIPQAVARVGAWRIAELVASMSLQEVFAPRGDAARGLWVHSVETAVLSRGLASLVPGVAPGEAYLAGLVHDLGRSILLAVAEEEAALLPGFGPAELAVDEVTAMGGLSLERERRCLDFDHAAVGGRAALAIGLGEGLAARIARHHEPGEDPAASLLALCDAISVHAHLRPELFVEGTPEGAELEALLERCLPAAWSAQGPLRPADIARGLPALLAEARHLTERLGG